MDILTEVEHGHHPTLETTRSVLQRLEEDIIDALMFRAQFKRNLNLYEPSPEGGLSLFDRFMVDQETMHAKYGRFRSPDYEPFTDPTNLPEPIIPPQDYGDFLKPHKLTITNDIKSLYFEYILPQLAAPGSDQNFGETVHADAVLLALFSRRCMTGKFVAEVKLRMQPDEFWPLIEAGDEDGLMELLTKKDVEKKVMVRTFGKGLVRGKVLNGVFDSKVTDENGHCRWAVDLTEPFNIQIDPRDDHRMLNPEAVETVFTNLITLTKKVEVEYLMTRDRSDMKVTE